MPANIRTVALAVLSLIFGGGAVILATAPPPGTRGATERIVRDYLLTHPEILLEMQDRLESNQQAASQMQRERALAAIDRSRLVDPAVAFTTGPADAKVTVVEFFDYKCPYCKAAQPALEAAMKNHPNVRFAFVEYPILSAESLIAARAAVASRRQDKYVPFHMALMEERGALSEERIYEIATEVGIDVEKLKMDMQDPAIMMGLEAGDALARELGITGTPSFIINDKIHIGQVSEAELTSLIREAES